MMHVMLFGHGEHLRLLKASQIDLPTAPKWMMISFHA
jgi:hypothetical protein